jgi:FkbM family methyltransferase
MQKQTDSPYERMRLRLFQAYAWLWRFKTLALTEKLFGSCKSPSIVARRFFGYDLYLDVSRSSAQRLLYLEGERFVNEAALVKSLLKPGGTVVDVGANIGYITMLCARAVGTRGRIIAFEPEPDNLVELRMNVECNGLSNIEIRTSAVGAGTGEVVFARGINGGVCSDPAASDAIRVSIVALDTALTGTIDMIKIDVEGYEGEVLAGAKETIRRERPAMFIEIHPALLPQGHSVQGILDFLDAYYENIEIYQPVRHRLLREKLAARYLNRGSIVKLNDREAVLAACEQGQQDTFWAICQARAQLVQSS